MKITKPQVVIFVLLVIVLFPVGVMVNSKYNVVPRLANRIHPPARVVFPEVDTNQLSPTQLRIVSLLKQEYEAQPKGTKYSNGIDEPWCADFVSWVFKEAGVPLVNPYTKSWRIPGTITLREYYQSIGKFKAADSGYSPKVGDIMFYDNPSPFGQHTNMVIKNDNGVVTTVGGNEPGIHIVVHTKPDGAGFIGYGIL